MRNILETEIKKERCNAAALGAFNASVGVAEWNEEVDQQEKKDKNITKYEKELKNLKSFIEISEKEIDRFVKIGNIAAKNDEIERIKSFQAMYDKANTKLNKAIQNSNNTPRLVRRETQKGKSQSWESVSDKFIKGKKSGNFNFEQKRTLEKHKKIAEAIDSWKNNKSTTEVERTKNIKYFTNLKLINLQEIKRQFRLKDLK